LAHTWESPFPTSRTLSSCRDDDRARTRRQPHLHLEIQARYIGCDLSANDSDIVCGSPVKQSVHDRYIERVDAEHAQLVWSHPGMGRITATPSKDPHWSYHGGWSTYFQMTRRPDLADFELTYATPLSRKSPLAAV